jgi:hypothetical protein
MMKITLTIILICLSGLARAGNSDDSYSKKWCKLYKGEYQKVLADGSKPDCVLENSVAEVRVLDKASKVYDSVGQALHHAVVIKKKPQIVYVIEKPEQNMYLERIKAMIVEYKLPITLIEYSTKKVELPAAAVANEDDAKIEDVSLTPQEEAAAAKAKAKSHQEMDPGLDIKMKADPEIEAEAAAAEAELSGSEKHEDVAIQLRKIASEPPKACKKNCGKKKACKDSKKACNS